jgi:hypothetical protein
MRKSHFNDEFLVLLGPIISRFFARSNVEKNKPKQQWVHALAFSLWLPVANALAYFVRVSLTEKVL